MWVEKDQQGWGGGELFQPPQEGVGENDDGAFFQELSRVAYQQFEAKGSAANAASSQWQTQETERSSSCVPTDQYFGKINSEHRILRDAQAPRIRCGVPMSQVTRSRIYLAVRS